MSDAIAERIDCLALTSEIVSAYLGNNHVQVCDLLALIHGVHAKLVELASGEPAVPEPEKKLTSAQIKRSIKPEHLISFEDGKPYMTLRRHLALRGLSPDEYRAKWGLPSNYPMTSASYSAQRSEQARSTGLGRHRPQTPDEAQA